MSEVFVFLGGVISQVFSFVLPGIGIAFGSLVVAVVGLPILVKMFRKLMG